MTMVYMVFIYILHKIIQIGIMDFILMQLMFIILIMFLLIIIILFIYLFRYVKYINNLISILYIVNINFVKIDNYYISMHF